jgi:hypothetical protein
MYAFYSSYDFRKPTSDFRRLLIPPIHATEDDFVWENFCTKHVSWLLLWRFRVVGKVWFIDLRRQHFRKLLSSAGYTIWSPAMAVVRLLYFTVTALSTFRVLVFV